MILFQLCNSKSIWGNGDPLKMATFDMLTGQEEFADVQTQARLQAPILYQSMNLVKEALRTLPEDRKIILLLTAVKQEANENCMPFLVQLCGVLERSPLVNVAREAILLSLAIKNANSAYKCILQGLPKSASLVDMMEVCSRTGTAEEQANLMAEVFAAAIKPLVQQGRGDHALKCYSCRNLGHTKAPFRAGSQSLVAKGVANCLIRTCNHCQKVLSVDKAAEC